MGFLGGSPPSSAWLPRALSERPLLRRCEVATLTRLEGGPGCQWGHLVSSLHDLTSSPRLDLLHPGTSQDNVPNEGRQNLPELLSVVLDLTHLFQNIP